MFTIEYRRSDIEEHPWRIYPVFSDKNESLVQAYIDNNLANDESWTEWEFRTKEIFDLQSPLRQRRTE